MEIALFNDYASATALTVCFSIRALKCAYLFQQIQALWLLRRVLAEHTGTLEWRRTVTAQLVALTGRLWLETHVADPALRAQTHTLTALTSMNIDEEEVGMYQDF